MKVLDGFVDTSDPTYIKNYEQMQASVADLESHIQENLLGGGEFAMKRHLSRGKLAVRDRISEIIDPGTPFMELSQMAAHDLYDGDKVPAAGMVTGIGTIHGQQCMIVGNDATVKGGSYYPVTVKKHLRA